MQQYRYLTDTDPGLSTSSQSNVISLKELCANNLVSTDVLSPTICRKLPQKLRSLLIQCAIEHDSKTLVTALLNVWQNEVFSFETPVSIERWKVFLWQKYRYHESQYFIPLIVEHIIDSLSSDCENQCQIRCLDFSSFPIQSFHLHSVYRLLIEKCSMFPQHEIGSSVKKKCSEEQNFHNNFLIKINAIVDDEEDLSLLCETISHLKDNNTALNLQVTGIRLTSVSISCKNILQLLDLIEPQTLDAFSCSLNFSSDYIPHAFELMQKLKNFPNLRTLTFELEHRNSEYHARIFFELSDLFHHLKDLKHLSINSYYVSSEVFEFHIDQKFPLKLSFMSEHLESLQLIGCRISADDLKNSSLFPKALALKTLNLANTEVDLQSLVYLLTLCKNLLDFTVARCEFSGGNIELLFQAFPAMKRLEYLNIKDIKMSPDDLMPKAEYISRMPNLKYLFILPTYDFLQGSNCLNFLNRFRRAVEMLWNRPTKCQ